MFDQRIHRPHSEILFWVIAFFIALVLALLMMQSALGIWLPTTSSGCQGVVHR